MNTKGASKIIVLKGKRQVGALTSGARDELVNVQRYAFQQQVASYMPTLIFPKKVRVLERTSGWRLGGLDSYRVHRNRTVSKWFKKVVQFFKASKDAPVPQLLDRHSSQRKNLELINYARNNGVIVGKCRDKRHLSRHFIIDMQRT